MSSFDQSASTLERALEACEPYLDPYFVANMRRKVRGLREREEWGRRTLLVTLCGGTGVGKSALFNAIARSHFSDSAPLRPTTRSPHVCLWEGAEPRLATQLGAQERDVMAYNAALSGEHPFNLGTEVSTEQAPTSTISSSTETSSGTEETSNHKKSNAAIMLVDLPDTDSVEFSHGVRADQAMRESDVLVWVLDGQKYADHIAHDNYLSRPQVQGKHLIVVLNQIDLIPFEQRGEVVRDIQRLLALDGTAGVPFFFTSATQGSGIRELEEYIASLDARVLADQARLATLAHDAATLEAVIEGHRHSSEQARMACADVFAEEARLTRETLLTLAGTERLARSLASGQMGRKGDVVQVEPASQMLVEASMESYMAGVCGQMLPTWQEHARAGVADADTVRRDMARALRTVPVPARSKSAGVHFAFVGAVVCAIAAVCGVLALVGAGPFATALAGIATLGGALGASRVASYGIFSLLAVALGGGLILLWRASRRKVCADSAEAYREGLCQAAGKVLDEELFAPLARVWDGRAQALADIAAVREAANVRVHRRAHVRH